MLKKDTYSQEREKNKTNLFSTIRNMKKIEEPEKNSKKGTMKNLISKAKLQY